MPIAGLVVFTFIVGALCGAGGGIFYGVKRMLDGEVDRAEKP